MRILSLDTSFSFFNFSIIEDGRVQLLHYIDSSKKTLENLPKLLADMDIRVGDFDAFAVSVGVGYLTSVRIGVTFMKTTAYLLGKPIVSYENLFILSKYTQLRTKKVPFLRVSTNTFYRVEDDMLSDIKIYKGETLEGVGISLEIFRDFSPTDETFLYQVFPFSAYGGIYAYQFLKEHPHGEDIFKIEPVYVKPPL